MGRGVNVLNKARLETALVRAVRLCNLEWDFFFLVERINGLGLAL